jgi:hypothetical protein
MRHRNFSVGFVSAAAIAVIACLVVMPDSPHMQSAFARAAAWMLVVAAMAVTVAVAVRASMHHRLSRQLLQLSRPATIGATAIRELSGIEGAFVAGLFRPRIFCASGLAARLTADELRGVLLHEQYHQLDRAPAKLVVLDAVAPLLRRFRTGRAWLLHRLAVLEVAADGYALRHGTSRATLAGALLKLEPRGAASPGIGFATVAELRIRALLDPATVTARGTTSRWVVQLAIAAASICLLLLPLR